MQVVEMVRELGSNGRAVKSKFGKFRGGAKLWKAWCKRIWHMDILCTHQES